MFKKYTHLCNILVSNVKLKSITTLAKFTLFRPFENKIAVPTTNNGDKPRV